MKRVCLVLGLAFCLCGCGAQQTMETVNDEIVTPVVAAEQQVELSLPEGATLEVAEAEGKLYLCEDYTVAVQTLDAGDLDKTLRTVTGYGADQLTLMRLQQGEFDRYECAWASAGEEQQVGRTLILDDGNYHYTVTVLAPAELAGKLTEDWQALMASVRIGQLSTGS